MMGLLSGSLFLLLLFLLISIPRSKKKVFGNQQVARDVEKVLFADTIHTSYFADSLFNLIEEDSVKKDLILKYSLRLSQQGDSIGFRVWNTKALEFSKAARDTSGIAESFWDLGNFFYAHGAIDSAYFSYNRSFQLYDSLGDDYLSGKMLLNMAIIQAKIKDYEGSEVTTIMSLKRIKPLGKFKQLYMAYNNLGVLYNELGQFDQALQYHSSAVRYAEKLEKPLLEAASLNNIGVVRKNKGQYNLAKRDFSKALKRKDLIKDDPQLYAMLIDNLTHAAFLADDGDEEELESGFMVALKLREQIDHSAGITKSKIHLGQFYSSVGDTLRAISYASEAMNLAFETKNFQGYLESILFAAKIDHTNSKILLEKYISLNDSLQKNERAVRNKFARIRFETDEFIAENEQLTEQKKWLIGGSAGGLVLSFLTILVFRQKARNRRLKNERDQQKANEDIYKLLLEQENKVERGKKKEQKRISKELHDGVLSKIFGIRFTLSHLNSKHDQASIETKEKYLDDLRQVEQEIRTISHDFQKDQFRDVGFLKILKHLVEDQTLVLGFSPSLKIDSHIPWERIDGPVKMNLYRIVQEALQNIHKYAGASEAYIELQNCGTYLAITVSDDGEGFDVEKKVRGIGLKNMRSRVKEIKGSCEISSSSLGTKIALKVPING